MPEAGLIPGLTLEEAIREACRRLHQLGIESANVDARALVGAATGLSKLDMMRHPFRPLTSEETRVLSGFLNRRSKLEPVSRILGSREFFGRPFKVTPETLDPRPETETLIEAALELVRLQKWQDREIRIVDVGTGTGCILITLLAELPLARGTALDISRGALDVARENASSHGVAERMTFHQGRGLEGVEGHYDLLVSNPPYIASREIALLDADVRDYDPRLALEGGPDGLDVYRQIIGSVNKVTPSGWVLFEVGSGQAEMVSELLKPATKSRIRVWKDLGGVDRCVAALTQF